MHPFPFNYNIYYVNKHILSFKIPQLTQPIVKCLGFKTC